jgi:hypothetical protein
VFFTGRFSLRRRKEKKKKRVFLKYVFSLAKKIELNERMLSNRSIGQQECVVNGVLIKDKGVSQLTVTGSVGKFDGRSHQFSCELLLPVTLLFLAVERK